MNSYEVEILVPVLLRVSAMSAEGAGLMGVDIAKTKMMSNNWPDDDEHKPVIRAVKLVSVAEPEKVPA